MEFRLDVIYKLRVRIYTVGIKVRQWLDTTPESGWYENKAERRCVMRLAICATEEHVDAIKHGLQRYREQTGQVCAAEAFLRRDQLLYRMREAPFDAVFLAMPGALGMETALSVRGLHSAIPLVWASDQREFVPQSYRIRTSMFLLTPLTPTSVVEALLRLDEELDSEGQHQIGWITREETV